MLVQFKDIEQIDNGACFHNVDLHIHTYGGSHDVKDRGMTSEAIVDSAVSQHLSVIAITDHNSNANVQKAVDYAREKHGNKILVLPGVEVTTAHGHLLVYFRPERAADLAKFLARLDLTGDMGAENTRTAKSMADTIAEAERFAAISIAAHIDREKTGFEAFAAGFQNWKRDIITSPGLYGLECDTVDALTWYSEHDEPGSAGAERKKILAARRSVSGLSGRHHLAHLQGSDSHSMKQFEHQKSDKPWTRIKLTECSFEALRLALIDPTARVRAKGVIPRSVPRILGIAMTGGFLHDEKIHFSDNLNSFIGGRGTGKSTAIRALAYAFGVNDEFDAFDNCPDSVTVFCEDTNGVRYKYIRTRGGDVEVKVKEAAAILDAPLDSFRIEYFGQGELTKVAEDPLKHPELFQHFLDRHTNLRDLKETEESLVVSLRENAARLVPLETSFSQLRDKKKSLLEVEQKLKIAEDGNLREVVGKQSKLASERAVRDSVDSIITDYNNGRKLQNIQRSFNQIVTTAGTCTDDAQSVEAMAGIKAALARNNLAVQEKERELNELLKVCAGELSIFTGALRSSHQRMSGEVAEKLADLKKRNIATDIPGLEALLRQKTALAREIGLVEQRADERKQCHDQRVELRAELRDVRNEMTARRKNQLTGINSNLSLTIRDYTIFVKYDDSGITAEFVTFMQEKMHGTYLQDNLIETLCSNIAPSALADLILDQDAPNIAILGKISVEWANKIVDNLCYWRTLFELQVLAKQPKPVVTVLTRSAPPKEIPVLHLSDGQRHTILLTIAMLADSNIPLVIDQPEDDLDNAFIFASIVTTLRQIKEKRQVILVTHNANIAVLGDSELILPMHRENDCGKAKDRGSIDAGATKACVIGILEGGKDAFMRRKEMYNH